MKFLSLSRLPLALALLVLAALAVDMLLPAPECNSLQKEPTASGSAKAPGKCMSAQTLAAVGLREP